MTKYDFMVMVANEIKTALEKKKEVEKGFQDGDFEFEYEIWTGYDDDYTLTYFEDDNTFYLENDLVEVIVWNDNEIEAKGKGKYKDFVANMLF